MPLSLSAPRPVPPRGARWAQEGHGRTVPVGAAALRGGQGTRQLGRPAEMVQVVAGCRVLSLVGNVTLFYIKACAGRCSGRRRGVGCRRRHCFWPRRGADPLTFRRCWGLREAGGQDEEEECRDSLFGSLRTRLRLFRALCGDAPPLFVDSQKKFCSWRDLVRFLPVSSSAKRGCSLSF